MPELLKNIYDKEYIHKVAISLKRVYPSFNAKKFEEAVLNDFFYDLELKARLSKIAQTLNFYLPPDFEKAVEIILRIAPDFRGFHGMFLPEYVGLFGLQNWTVSQQALRELTIYSSSEFAVRYFLKSDLKKMLNIMQKWSTDSNEHVRRLASEGCRPRLPWAMRIHEIRSNPQLILPILKELRNDSSEYVAKSVANNLNDISKDHPELVINLASQWLLEKSVKTKVIKHGCRSLLKSGHPLALQIFGFGNIESLTIKSFRLQSTKIKLGQDIQFYFTIQLKNKAPNIIRMEYCIYYLKKNGSYSKKVFKISESQWNESREISRKHSTINLSTRKHYLGEHFISLQINGVELGKKSFEIY